MVLGKVQIKDLISALPHFYKILFISPVEAFFFEFLKMYPFSFVFYPYLSADDFQHIPVSLGVLLLIAIQSVASSMFFCGYNPLISG